MQAARWPDELRIIDRQYYRGPWHYINWPFKPEGQPASVQMREPEQVNILTALAENQGVVKNANDPERKAIALAWRLLSSVSPLQSSITTVAASPTALVQRGVIQNALDSHCYYRNV